MASKLIAILLFVFLGVFFALTIVFAALYGVERNKTKSPPSTTAPTNSTGTDLPGTTTQVPSQNNVCLTPYCVKAANYLLQSIDKTANPCENFFEFACGTWLKNNRIPDDAGSVDTFNGLRNQLDVNVVDMLTLPVPNELNNVQSINSARLLYTSCINETALALEAESALLNFVDNELGGWPILQGSSWNESSFDLANLMYKLREYNQNIVFGFSTSTDEKNSSAYFIQLYQSDLALEQRSNYVNVTKLTDAYEKLIQDIASALTTDTTMVVSDARDIFDFEKNISVHHWTPAEERARQNETVRTTIGNLTELLNTTFDFKSYIEQIYALSNVPLNDDDTISVSELDFIRNASAILDAAPPRAIQNYFVWRFIMNRISDMSKRIRNIKEPFDEAFRGTVAQRPRSITCGNTVNNYMGFAISKIYIRQYFDESARNESVEMIKNIRSTFIDMLKNSTWIDEVSKNRSMEKALAIDEKIGYPEYMASSNLTEIENMYKDYVFTSSYIENILKVLQLRSNESLRTLRDPVDRKAWGPSPPTTVNAFYSPSKNQIIFPGGILQSPFFDKNAPKYLNYGGIGVVIGHEITHGFDDSGRQFDKDGNRISWWTQATIDEFTNRKQCIIDQYSNYLVTQINQTLNGNQTQGENIADNGGIKESFYAYQKWATANVQSNQKLPGLEKYSPEQMFFMNYGQIWCTKMTDANALNRILTGVHSPGEFRIRGPTSNFDEFDRVFGCTPGQGNSQLNKCAVW
ncbi:unnamed protein product [Rotaria magnacalcarata]|uniref:Neprilysin n=2 Tax=Rotaria magnacalcarata TaxID=392030 RepID=A0A816ZRS2_9BILA|nr:unnamed protein product [Rotaria magnacalcarata]CAF2220891.1 unnamed protein product [Rotaria magnacalcarata]